jgi:hypothetical protein
MKMLDKVSDKSLIILGSLGGYLITALTMIVIMNFKTGVFPLTAAVFIPFAAVSFVVIRWFGPKVIAAAISQKAIGLSLVGGFIIAYLTGILYGIASCVIEITFHGHVFHIRNVIFTVGTYTFAAFLYALPGVLISGITLGKVLNARMRS